MEDKIPTYSGKKNSIISYFNNITILLCIFVMLWCLIATEEKHDYYGGTLLTPQVVNNNDGSKTYIIDVTAYSNEPNSIRFYSVHQNEMVYVDDELVYTYGYEKNDWTSTSGIQYHFVSIPKNAKTIVIEETACYDVVNGNVMDIYVGDPVAMVKSMLVAALPNFLASLAIVVVGVCLTVYNCYLRTIGSSSKDMRYLAMLSIVLGIWAVNETDIVVLLTHNKAFCANLAYFMLMLFPIPFMLFVRNYLEVPDKHIHKCVCAVACISFFTLTVLNVAKIREYKENLVVIQAVLVMSMAYFLYSLILKAVRQQFTRRFKIVMVGAGMVLATFISDIFLYEEDGGDADIFGRYFYLVFLVMLAYDLVKNTNEYIKKGRYAKKLEVFAITDSMTGLYNRNAYEAYLSALDSIEGIGVIAIDLNNLKQINDNYGHEMGDVYIRKMSHIIKDTFEYMGECYRIGGDEFCCVVSMARADKIEKAIRETRARIKSINDKGDYNFEMHMAIGYAIYDFNQDKVFADITKRADIAMYNDKKALKENEVKK